MDLRAWFAGHGPVAIRNSTPHSLTGTGQVSGVTTSSSLICERPCVLIDSHIWTYLQASDCCGDLLWSYRYILPNSYLPNLRAFFSSSPRLHLCRFAVRLLIRWVWSSSCSGTLSSRLDGYWAFIDVHRWRPWDTAACRVKLLQQAYSNPVQHGAFIALYSIVKGWCR
jgi:hypothetical protein